MQITEITKKHNRKGFDCGTEPLNAFLTQIAPRAAERHLSKTHILTAKSSPSQVLGYYTLTFAEVKAPKDSRLYKNYPHHLPAIKLARLAVDKRQQGKGFGECLLFDALTKAVIADKAVPIIGIFVDSKNEQAKAFYLRYGFEEVDNEGDGLYLWLPIATCMEAVAALGRDAANIKN